MNINKYIDYIKNTYSENDLIKQIDEQMLEYVDYDQMKEDGIDDEYEHYTNYCTNEAETDIIEGLVREIQEKFKVTFDIDTFIKIGKEIALYIGIEDKY